MTFSISYKVLLVHICKNLHKPTCIKSYDVKDKARVSVMIRVSGTGPHLLIHVKIAPVPTSNTPTTSSTTMYLMLLCKQTGDMNGSNLDVLHYY